jgi:Protein of unknown function (DUF2934)
MINAPTITEEAVRVLAHKFWEEEGRPEGRAEAHWLRAVTAFDVPTILATAAPAKKSKAKK